MQFWNLAAEQITGIGLEQAVGSAASKLLVGWDEIAPSIPVAGVGRPKRQLARLLPFEIDGRELWLSLCGVDVADATVYSFQDRTDEQTLDKLRDDFVATASHELRTPLAAIYGAAKTLRREDGLDDEGAERLMAIISSESERLARVIDDILLASHLDSGRLKFASTPVDVRALVTDVVESMQVHLQSGVTLQLDAPPNGLPAVSVDAIKLRRVLQNLVDNAIKYSPEGGPVVVRVEVGGNGRVRLQVNDEGLGIPRAEQERIFEKFYRADPQLARGVGGTGLGLYICRELVQRMGGAIEVESEPGKGSTFTVDLPVRAAVASR